MFDYIIVGAGSAGCVLADRLTVDGRKSVLLIEAGPLDNSPFIDMPRGLVKLLSGSPYVNSYQVRKGGNAGTATWVKGRGIGGSSSINGMVYARGHPEDFEAWEAGGCPGWGWDEIRAAYREVEGHAFGATETRGGSGPLKISVHGGRTQLSEALLRAGQQQGLEIVDDPNEHRGECIGYQPMNIHRGRRMSAARAFLRPALKRRNLTVLADTQVLRVAFEGTRAIGVDVKGLSGERTSYRATEIILSAGALETPKLLQLSGVGAGAHLKALGIPVVKDSPQVGRNLRDHLNFPMVYRVTAGSYTDQFKGLGLLSSVLLYQFARRGPLTHAAYELMAFAKSNPSLTRPDAQLGFTLAGMARNAKGEIEPTPFHAFTVHDYYTRPTSQGYCRIQSAHPDTPLDIDANFLATEEDRRRSIDAVRLTDRLVRQPAMAKLLAGYVGPPLASMSDNDVLDALREFGSSALHVAGTCRMGSDPEAVVDPQLRLRGVTGLRVMDTSIMPSTPTGNTNAPVIAMAWRGAKLIQATPAAGAL